ncbi:MAG: bifunctional 3-demethylubiquinol 3-O-methyltransferase/2-polyprenyl-6-hydroxyphenol methylase [Alphaproteobacteria bacterium]|nr:MAG: bifunctional 3-demethylubiquinol 3-O-methyltransferase/2-polyprenyl-6-hydroxyphenol methylase [Alphaproteobacteria bacterium]
MYKKSNEQEISFFNAVANWWDARGMMAPLHQMNQIRMAFIHAEISNYLFPQTNNFDLSGLEVLDVGCGGGLASEPMARLGATVTGVDASHSAIRAASIHAQEMNLSIDYQCQKIESLDLERSFDIVLALEVIEHVDDIAEFLVRLRSHLKPGGLVFISTINQTAKSYAVSILAAEYFLRLLPRGTHDWQKFVKPSVLRNHLQPLGLEIKSMKGMAYRPFYNDWVLNSDISNNYIICARQTPIATTYS